MTKRRIFEKRFPRRLHEAVESWRKEYDEWRRQYLDRDYIEQEVYELTDPTNVFGYITKRQAEGYVDYAMEWMEAEADMVEDGLKEIKSISDFTKQDFENLYNEIRPGSLLLKHYKNSFHIDVDWLYGVCEYFLAEVEDGYYEESPEGFAEYMMSNEIDAPNVMAYDEVFNELVSYAEEEREELLDPENIVEWCNRHSGAYVERFNRKSTKKRMRESMHRFNRHPVNRRK